MPTTFLCHNSQDKPIVQRLGKLLEQNGIEPWIDSAELDGGSGWQDEILTSMNNSDAVLLCVGPHGIGRFQRQEIEVVVQHRVEAGKSVVPVILPTCENEPEVPVWLSMVQHIDLRQDCSDLDPFGRLLQAIDGRDANQHLRPSVLVLRNAGDTSNNAAIREVIRNCRSKLHRVREVDYSDVTLEFTLQDNLKTSDVFVSILAADAFTPRPGIFRDGIASGAMALAKAAGIPATQWRSDNLVLPSDERESIRFRSPQIETWQPFDLARHVVSDAIARFEPPASGDGDGDSNTEVVKRRKSILGLPPAGNAFAGSIAEIMNRHGIRCDSKAKWQRIVEKLQKRGAAYDALIVILNGDPDWRDQCEEWLDELEETPECLPSIGAYCYQVDNSSDAEPVPLDLEQFERYYGRSDLPKLALRINRNEGIH